MRSTLTMCYPTAWHGDMWREGAPCGNGIIGALVYGGIGTEMILLNHTDLWRGGKICDIPDVSASLSEVRRLLDEERPDLANGVLSNALRSAGYSADTASPFPVCDIRIGNHTNVPFTHYRRVIDMERAEVRVTWQEGNTKYTRSTFVSREDGLCYTRILADGDGTIHVDVALTIHDTETMRSNMIENLEIRVENDMIFYAADNTTVYKPAMGSYGAVMRVSQTGGVQENEKDHIRISGAKEVLLVTALFVGMERTDGFADAEKQLSRSADYETALKRHTEKHSALFHGVEFSLTEPSEGEDPSNEQLLLDAYDSEMSNALTEKMYAYGRYLFLCSTDPILGKPTHLVGLWNGTYSCFWAFHMFNVNFEMIYWQALTGNLPDFLKSALDYVEGFMDDFRDNAKNIYGCRGIYIDSVNTPESGKAACLADHIINWTAGAAWVSEHFYDYYRYTGDETYLREHALPFMAEAALFYEDFLTIGPDGKYQFYPCTSPENVPLSTMRKFNSWAQVAKNASLDIAAVRELLLNLLEGAKITGLYTDKCETWEKMLSLLPDYKYNEDGSLKEWADDFYTDNNAHRHHSHMYGVFPGHTVRRDSPEFDAFVKAEDNRIGYGLGPQSSWSMVFMACINARMYRGEVAFHALSEMVRNCCMNNLFTLHNDWRRMGQVQCDDMRLAPFQIDANIGFPAAVNEMLLCSAGGIIELFPALPSKWEKGKMEGLLTVGGHLVSLYWEGDTARAVLRGGYRDSAVIEACGPWVFADGRKQVEVKIDGTLELTLHRNAK